MAKKAKKAPPPPAAGAPAWMATFSDMVTLLLAFFVMLMAMANFEDNKRVDAVVESIHVALGAAGIEDGPGLVSNQMALSEESVRPDTVRPTMARLRQAMSKHVSDELVQLSRRESEIRIQLDEQVFFRQGSAELHPASYGLLSDVAAVLADTGAQVRVEGHADAQGSEAQNWRLSALRSVVVVEELRQRGPIHGERLTATAFGAFRPATANAEDSALNRRIELVVKVDDANSAGAAYSLEGDEYE